MVMTCLLIYQALLRQGSTLCLNGESYSITLVGAVYVSLMYWVIGNALRYVPHYHISLSDGDARFYSLGCMCCIDSIASVPFALTW